MGVRNWFEKRKAKITYSRASNQTNTRNAVGNQIDQQHQENSSLNEPLDKLDGADRSSKALKNARIEDTPIRELWGVAYDKLREEDSALASDYEAKLIGSVAAGIGQTLNLKQNRREWMQAILQSKMDEVEENKSKFRVQARDTMQVVLNIVNSANDYIGNAASANPYTSIAWTGVSFLLPLFMNMSEETSSLAKGLEYIASLIAQSQMREDLYVECYESGTNRHDSFRDSHIQYKITLEKLYRQILRFQVTTCCYYSKHSALRHSLDAIKWNDWAPLVDEVREQERNFAAVEELWRDIQRHQERLAAESLHHTAISSLSAINANLSALTNKEFDELLQWLCHIDPSSMYNAARDRHETGTCEWLIKNTEEFKTWKTSDGSLLWLHGKAGSGKSILTSSVIKNLRDRCASEPSSAIAYFYFSFSDPKKQEVDGMLASLIKQICSHQPHTSQLIQRLRGFKIKGERPDTETLEAILIDSASEFTNLYVVIDALDECPLLNGQRGKLLKSLRRILAIAPGKLHIFLTSRKEPDIDGKLRSILSYPDRIEIDLLVRQQILNDDIDHYINSQLSTEDYDWPPSVKEEARKTLLEKADCMFQYVRFQLEALQNLSSETEIRKALQDLPVGLDETYNRILDKIDPKFQEQVIHALKWLAFSKKIFTIKQFAEIFIMPPHDDIAFDERKRLFSPTDTLKYFSGLVVVDQKDVPFVDVFETTEIRLVHFSLKEYLVSSRIADGPTRAFSFTETNAHLSIAQSCLTYLNHLNPWVASHGNQYFDKDVATLTYPLAEYTVQNWMTHLEQIPRVSWSAKITRDAASALAVNSQSLLTLLVSTRFFDLGYGWILKPSSFAAHGGHLQLTEMLIYPEYGVKKYVTREELGEALHIVALGGNTDMMQVFLKAGADADAQHVRWGTALQAAASHGHLDALKFLVSSGVNVNSPPNIAGCVLTDIPEQATDCLKFLLDNGADINMQDKTYGTALHEAIEHGYDANFDLLLERGADVNALGRCGTPLQRACITDQPSPFQRLDPWKMARYVKKLLESGADPNLRGGDYGTALQLACGNSALFPNHRVAMEIVQLLIDKGTVENGAVVNGVIVRESFMDIESYNPEMGYGHPVAADSVHPAAVEVVKLLLDNGAKVDQPGGTDWGMALHEACIRRNEEGARWLLDHGADVNAESSKYSTPLQAMMSSDPFVFLGVEAWVDGFKEDTLRMVQLLISKGAQLNQVNQTGGLATVLQAACYNPDIDVEMVRFLLEHGADVNAEGGEYRTALGVACAGAANRDDWLQLVQLLIKHGADVNAKDEKYRAPLTIACKRPGKELVQLLLESGADVRHQNYAAWYAAAGSGSSDALTLLLDQGIDINHVDEEYGTALSVTIETFNTSSAHWQDWHDRVHWLLEHGADVEVKGGKYGFVLQTACAPESLGVGYLPKNINAISGRTKFLLEQCSSIDVNEQGGVFGSALQAAAFSGQAESVGLLLDRGADADARGGKYGSALNAAIFSGYWDIVEVLLQAGATPDYRLQQQPDEEWLRRVGEEWPQWAVGEWAQQDGEYDGRCAVARYRKFWEVESGSGTWD